MRKKSKKRGPVTAKKISYDGINFASGLERYTYMALKKEKLFEFYEGETFHLIEGFELLLLHLLEHLHIAKGFHSRAVAIGIHARHIPARSDKGLRSVPTFAKNFVLLALKLEVNRFVSHTLRIY